MNGLRFIVVMGVSGCGKSTVASLLAQRLGWLFAEGDLLHPPANVEKMRQGVPLTDEDRIPWLQEIAGSIGRWRADGTAGVVACSALRRQYREIIADGAADLCFVYLRGGRSLIRERLLDRRGHFMPSTLLDSQLDTLEEPASDEPALTVETTAPAEELVEAVLRTLDFDRLSARAAGVSPSAVSG